MALKIKINGSVYEAQSGEYILDVCRRNDIYIPAMCHHEGLPGLGSCRLCVVEVNEGGANKVVVSCVYPLSRDCEVFTDSEKIFGIRRTILSMLKKRSPDCRQILFLCLHYGVKDDERFTYNPANENQTDAQKRLASSCILCGLCVQACASLGTGAAACCAAACCAISTVGRGVEKKVSTPYDEMSADCIGCASCASVCPAAAIKYTDSDGNRFIWGRNFILVKCASCGSAFATQEQYAYSIKKSAAQSEHTQNTAPSDNAPVLCDMCKKKKSAGVFAGAFGERKK